MHESIPFSVVTLHLNQTHQPFRKLPMPDLPIPLLE
jgi:hypothetical protein